MEKILFKKEYIKLSYRYEKMIKNENWLAASPKTTKEHILKMLKVLREEDMSIDKSSRFLGFIQGVLCAHGILDVDKERDYTRPLFQEVYKQNNIKQETIEVE